MTFGVIPCTVCTFIVSQSSSVDILWLSSTSLQQQQDQVANKKETRSLIAAICIVVTLRHRQTLHVCVETGVRLQDDTHTQLIIYEVT